MPKIVPNAYSTGYGFVSDYLAEVFHLLRRQNVGAIIEELVDIDAGGERNKTAIKKTCSGLMKLLYPNATAVPPDAEGLRAIIEVAVGGSEASRGTARRDLAGSTTLTFSGSHFGPRPPSAASSGACDNRGHLDSHQPATASRATLTFQMGPMKNTRDPRDPVAPPTPRSAALSEPE